jgi:carotenoid cleavage dioxygenase-like enzyme
MSQQAAEAPMNWFRQGVFAPVTEEVTAFDLPVTGRIPSELNGRYLRNGPNFMRGIAITSTIGSWAPAWCTA